MTCAVEILILSNAVDFLTKSLGMPYSVVTAQQACSTEMFFLKCSRTCINKMCCTLSLLSFSSSLSVDVSKLQVAILARSSREMYQTVRID